MNKCDKCEGENIQRKTHNKFHDEFECLTCGNWTFKRLEDCCRNPYMIVAQDHKFPFQTRLYRQCINCGGCTERAKPLSFKNHGKDCEGEFDNHTFEEWREEIREEAKMLSEQKKQFNYHNSSYYKYQVYLCSPEWRVKRELVLQRDNKICQDCTLKPAEEVHHLTYNSLFNEPLEDLKSLCKECHMKTHGKEPFLLTDLPISQNS